MSKPVWKSTVKRQIQYYVLNCLLESCQSNRKTACLRNNKFKSVDFLTKLDPETARVLIKARLRMFEVKVNFKRKYNYKLNCPFCTDETETFDHIFQLWGPLPSVYHVYDLGETQQRGRY